MRGRLAAMLAATATVLILGLSVLSTAPAGAAPAPQLTRYPYLTDVVSAGSTDNATINFATDTTVTAAFARIGPAGGTCTGTNRTGSKLGITVNGKSENQWKVKFTGLTPGNQYCYRVFAGSPTAPGADLLGSDPSPVFTAPGSGSFSFAVLGDWGFVGSSGSNPDQAKLDAQIAASRALFALGTGDTAYPGGSQTNYGDLQQTGLNISTVFGPSYYTDIGKSIPMFNSLGNHGVSATFLNTWPQPTAPGLSGGRYQIDAYPSINGSNPANYPSAWYAFNVGRARIYILDATWSNSNVGTGNIYSNDYAAHWTTSSPQYQWLASDLAAHSGLKIAVLHLPMYADNPTEHSDTYLHSGGTSMTDAPGSVATLLSDNGVQLVLNGHMHGYERNTKVAGESFVSYVTGGGGATLEPVGTGAAGCGSYDAYAIGWSPTKLKGYACGAAKAPTSASQVYHFLKVTVGSSSVTVTPTDSLGNTFDIQTYNF